MIATMMQQQHAHAAAAVASAATPKQQFGKSLGERCFISPEKFDNKTERWKAWWLNFLTAVGDCDPDFVDVLKDAAREDKPVDAVTFFADNPQAVMQPACTACSVR